MECGRGRDAELMLREVCRPTDGDVLSLRRSHDVFGLL